MWYIAGMPVVERNYALVANSLLWTTLAFIVLMLRLFTRAFIVKRVGVDDYLMTGAMICSFGFLVAIMYQIQFGLGQTVNRDVLVRFLKCLYVTIGCYNLSQTFYKLSITAQSYRLFATPRAQRWNKIMFGWILVCGIMTVSGSLFYCSPPRKAWDDSVDGWCVNRSALQYAIAGFNIFNDLLLLSIPAPFLLRLQVPKKQRVILICIFACGALVTVVSIIRLKSLYENLSGPIDMQPITGVDIGLWSHLEINLAIILLSVPAIQAFVTRVILGKKHGGSSSYPDRHGGPSGMSASRSRALQTFGSRSDKLDNMDPEGPMTIRVQQSIEMKSYALDDTGSEKDLITKQNFTPAIQSYTTVTGGSANIDDDSSGMTRSQR